MRVGWSSVRVAGSSTNIYIYIQGVPGGICQNSGECSIGQTIPI